MPDDIQSLAQSNAIVLPESKRVDVRWAQVSQAEATLNLIEAVRRYGGFDYYWLCSGQDFPLVESETIVDFLKERKTKISSISSLPKRTVWGKTIIIIRETRLYFPKGL